MLFLNTGSLIYSDPEVPRGLALGAHHSLDRVENSFTDLWSVGLNGEIDINIIGNNVWSASSMNAGAADDGKVFWTHFFGHERL